MGVPRLPLPSVHPSKFPVKWATVVRFLDPKRVDLYSTKICRVLTVGYAEVGAGNVAGARLPVPC